jgi:hypothetical protein
MAPIKQLTRITSSKQIKPNLEFLRFTFFSRSIIIIIASHVIIMELEQGWCRLNRIESRVQSAWIQRLKLTYDKLLSSFASKFNLHHNYISLAIHYTYFWPWSLEE